MTFREFSGKNVEEAIRTAMKEFASDLSDLDIEILSQGSRGILGVGGEEARILAAPKSAVAAAPTPSRMRRSRPRPGMTRPWSAAPHGEGRRRAARDHRSGQDVSRRRRGEHAPTLEEGRCASRLRMARRATSASVAAYEAVATGTTTGGVAAGGRAGSPRASRRAPRARPRPRPARPASRRRSSRPSRWRS